MANQLPSPSVEKLAKDLAKGSLNPRHGLTVPAKMIKATKA